MITLKLQEFVESKMGREHDGGRTGHVMFILGWDLLSMLPIRGRDSMLREKGPGGKMLRAGQGCVLDTMQEGNGDQ